MTLRSCWSLPILFLHTFSIHNPVIKQCTRLIIFLFLNVLKFVVQLYYGRLCQFQHCVMGDYASFNIISVYIWYDNQFYWLRRSEYTGKSPSSHWHHYVVSYLSISVSFHILQIKQTTILLFLGNTSSYTKNIYVGCWLTSNEQYFGHIMARTRYISMRGVWCLLCTKQTGLV